MKKKHSAVLFLENTYSLKSCDIVLTYDHNDDMSGPMGKPTICIGENKGADQLCGNREADQRLCFCYSDSKVPLLLKSEISRF